MTTNLLFSLFGNIQITKDTITLTHRHTKVDFMHSCPPCFHLNKQNLLFHFCSAVWLVQAEVKAALTQLQMGARPVDLCHLIKRVSNKESDHDNTPAHAVTHWKTHTYKSSTTWLQDRWHKLPHTHTHTLPHKHTHRHTHTNTNQLQHLCILMCSDPSTGKAFVLVYYREADVLSYLFAVVHLWQSFILLFNAILFYLRATKKRPK